MSFDEQPDPLSDCMEAFDKMKSRAEQAESRVKELLAEVNESDDNFTKADAENAVLRRRVQTLEADYKINNQTWREAREARLAAESARDRLAEKLGRLAREVSVTLDQWAHEREQGRSGVVYGSRIGLLREALREALAATEPDKPAAPAEKEGSK